MTPLAEVLGESAAIQAVRATVGRVLDVLRVADELGAGTVAFPAISTGVYGYPVAPAARTAIGAARSAQTRVREVRFVLFDERAYRAFERALADVRT